MSPKSLQVETCECCNRQRTIGPKGETEWTYDLEVDDIFVAGYAIILCDDCERNELVGSATQGVSYDEWYKEWVTP